MDKKTKGEYYRGILLSINKISLKFGNKSVYFSVSLVYFF